LHRHPSGNGDRERDFWDRHVPRIDECLRQYRAGPDPNTAIMLDALEPLEGKRVLDYACGVGVMSAWLADRGATVVGMDLSPVSASRAAEFCDQVGANATFVAGDDLSEDALPGLFDRIVGRYAIHHVDVATVAPLLAKRLEADGKAAFLETMSRNPVLRLARRHLTGRLHVPRYGTFDEHPLADEDLRVLEKAFGSLECRVAEMTFFRILDRQVFQYRSRRLSGALGALDDLLAKLGLESWSYHQVLILSPGKT
jgi:SAM-dependent methyltransferase